MMSEKILALIVSFVGGGTIVFVLGAKMMGFALSHSARFRQMCFEKLEAIDAEHRSGPYPLSPDLRDASLGDLAGEGVRLGFELAEEEARARSWPPHCDRCLEELEKPGALILSPPNQHGECTKFHVCPDGCYGGLVQWVSNGRVNIES